MSRNMAKKNPQDKFPSTLFITYAGDPKEGCIVTNNSLHSLCDGEEVAEYRRVAVGKVVGRMDIEYYDEPAQKDAPAPKKK